MTELETEILRIVKEHRGRARAIRAKTMAGWLGVSQREIRDAITRLIEVHRQKIASTVAPPYGYFIPETPEESDAYAANLKSRIRKTAVRLRAYEENTADRVLEQLNLGI